MRIFRNIMILVAGGMTLMTACDPIEDRDILANSFHPDDIQVEAIQSSSGTGNGITLKMNTPGVYGHWDYKLNKAYTNEVSFVSPFMGEVEFTYYVATPYIKNGNPSDREYVSKSVTVNVQVADNPVPKQLTFIAGVGPAGKTWVFARNEPLWWYMSSGGPSEPKNPFGLWWNAAECCAPPDQGGKMVFDLNGATNYTYYVDADGEPAGTGTFSFSPDFSKLTINGGVNILGGEGTGADPCASSINSFGEFEVIELSEDRMVLYIGETTCDSGWTWVFVPEE